METKSLGGKSCDFSHDILQAYQGSLDDEGAVLRVADTEDVVAVPTALVP